VEAKAQRGDGLVEFALVVPVIVIAFMAIFDMGRAFFVFNVIANMAREGARYGTIAPCDSDEIRARANASAAGLDPALLTITSNAVPGCPGADTIQVQVDYQFYPVTPFVVQLLGGASFVTLSSTSTMTVE
jgi:Flp pilus assembly protein TadG